MAKKSKSKAKSYTPGDVPCLRIVIGASKGTTGRRDEKGCVVAGEPRNRVTSWDVGKQYGSTSGNVKVQSDKRIKKSTKLPCSTKRKGCPVQLAFEDGQPFLRFCRTRYRPGYRVNVESPGEASKIAAEACAYWKSHRKSFKGFFPEGTPLRGASRRRRDRR